MFKKMLLYLWSSWPVHNDYPIKYFIIFKTLPGGENKDKQ